MNLLVITNRPLSSKTSGYDLRVWHLCQALVQEHTLILLSLSTGQPPGQAAGDFAPLTLFRDTVLTAPLPRRPASPRRHLRLNEQHYFPWAYPAFVAGVTAQIETLCRQHTVGAVLLFGADLLGLVKAGVGRQALLLDVCDSTVLTLRRASPGLALWRQGLSYTRWCRLEGAAPGQCQHVVTINQADTDTVRHLSGGRSNLSTMPNGVDGRWLALYRHRRRHRHRSAVRRGVAFWGNLDFAPNRDAVRFFYQAVYLPYLRPAGIEWCIAGGRADAWLSLAARDDPLLRLTGFVDDLPALLASYPIMVNPMRIGSGMKNKVLEAFAAGLGVVSTSVGMESIDGAVAGTSYLAAESGPEFFNAIKLLLDAPEQLRAVRRAARAVVQSRYTWDIVGARWRALVAGLRSAPAGPPP